MKIDLSDIYEKLLTHFGPQNWWPGKTQDEIIIGAILTQSVNWNNVEKAIQTLKQRNLCNLKSIYQTPAAEIAPLIRPTIYFNRKAEKLKAFALFVQLEFGGDLNLMFQMELELLRVKLLAVKGIGEETADSILLYAGKLPIFVIDSYTKMIFSRLGYLPEDKSYFEFQDLFMSNLPEDAELYNDFHAQLVTLGKNYCRKRNPKCERCPLISICRKQYQEN